ncbi:hypothetical protein B0H67DRAFT_3510 [Lasiosphaeris hirsuta]|uniref:Uncharacterized protein n=1 Tax=Lasiosphaeris hirsuta TaxID=260670 RepID=A0AA40B8J2_9PEZI|nr:hypothetical protein B0H67DRAFT_3510 [Lasiosphaeris hirsuta]
MRRVMSILILACRPPPTSPAMPRHSSWCGRQLTSCPSPGRFDGHHASPVGLSHYRLVFCAPPCGFLHHPVRRTCGCAGYGLKWSVSMLCRWSSDGVSNQRLALGIRTGDRPLLEER